VIQRKTQTAEYWQSFSLTQDDVDHLHNLLLDAEQPVTTGDLALAVVTERCRQEETVLRAELMRGALYQPRKKFNVGERIIFPALDFRMGEVIAVRPGQNPEHGSFEVVTVDFGPDRRQRSFAAALNAPHKLNADTPDLFVADELVSRSACWLGQRGKYRLCWPPSSPSSPTSPPSRTAGCCGIYWPMSTWGILTSPKP
jgi:hypothetical protein